MTLIRGGVIGPDGSGDGFLTEVESDRAVTWHAWGGVQGVIKGGVITQVAGQMAVDVAPLAALVSERDGSGNLQDRGFPAWSDSTTRVTFGPASLQARNDALVAAVVDVEDGAVGTAGLTPGAHLVVVPGVSGVATPRTDAQIIAFLGRGGFTRLGDFPIASTDVQINVGAATLAAPYNVRDTGWINLNGVVSTLRYRRRDGIVYVHVDGAVATTSGVVLTVSTSALPAWARPDIQVRGAAYCSGYPGILTVQADGVITALQITGAARASVAGMISYPN